MKIERTVCDLCDNDRDAVFNVKISSIGAKVTRNTTSSPKSTAYDACEYCHGEIFIFLDALRRTSGQ
jgi:hypothetical protein